MNIRILTPEDGAEYQNLRLQALKEHPEAFASSYEEEKEFTVEKYKLRLQPNEESVTFGAFCEEKLVGMVSLVREMKQKLRHRANIFAMYVAPDIRGTGTGKALMNAAIKHASTSGVEQLYLTVEATNEPAKTLYQTLHFEVYGKDKRSLKIEDKYYDEDHMVLYLS